ncbi:MAG: DUF1858 domain-containing protein [Clostridiales bacterium]|nr:DUF1858 domain-containing protein [Clostridiales bacterium]
MAKVNENMTIKEILTVLPDSAPIFYEFGMHCLGCPVASGEALKDAAAAHGVSATDLVAKLNEFAATQA